MRLSARDYIGHMETLGLFRPDHPVPELNASVWRAYLDLYDAHVGDTAAIEILVSPGGCGFYRDRLAGWDFYTLALLGPLSHPCAPFTAARMVADAPFIADLCSDVPVITETFVPLGCGPEGDGDPHFGWICSPLAQAGPSSDAYAASLAAKRRKQRSRLYRDYGGPDYRFDFSARPVSPGEFTFILDQTRARWGEDAAYALTQVLFPMAAMDVVPDSVRFMRVFRGETLLFLNTYLVRGDTMTSQSTTRNMDEETSGMGVMIDFRAVDCLCADFANGPVRALDPTCRTSIEDPGSIETAKREVVNADAFRPMLALGTAAQLAPLLPEGLPFFDSAARAWRMPQNPVRPGRMA